MTIQAKIAAQISAAMIANISDRVQRAYDYACVFIRMEPSMSPPDSRSLGASFSIPDASLTIREFCRAEKISRSMLYRAWTEGWGPRFYRIGVTRRITHRARLEWQREREATAAATDQTGPLDRRSGGPT